MSARAPGTAAVVATVVFELERFELVGERLEVGGRWSGIRGRRFLRPTLTAAVEGAERRVLAELEHKPWAAEDGAWWEAAFAWPAAEDHLDEAELAVAPDISVNLPGAALGSRASGRSEKAHSAAPTRLAAQQTGERRPYVDATPSRSTAPPRRGEHEALRRALADERAQTASLRTQLQRTVAAETETASALARRDAALKRVDELSAERDRRVAELRSEVERERSAAAEAVRALEELDATRAAHRRAEDERDAVRRERDELLEEHNRLLAERDRARDAAAAAATRRGGERPEPQPPATARAAGIPPTRPPEPREMQPAPGEHPAAGTAAPRVEVAGPPPPLDPESPAAPRRRATRGATTTEIRRPASAGLARHHDPRWLSRALAVTALLIALVLLTIVLRAV